MKPFSATVKIEEIERTMSIEPSNSTKKEIMNRYNKNPKGWYIFTGRDQRGFQDTVVIQGTDIWMLKEERINPYQTIGLSMKEELPDHFSRRGFNTFGYRPFKEDSIKSILESKGNEKNINNAIAKVLSNDPMPLDKLEGSSVLQGPVLQSPKTIQVLPESQRKLDQTLRKELDSLISRKYPHLRTTYG